MFHQKIKRLLEHIFKKMGTIDLVPSLQNTDNRRRYSVSHRQKPKLISMQWLQFHQPTTHEIKVLHKSMFGQDVLYSSQDGFLDNTTVRPSVCLFHFFRHFCT
jgi:hypothetical protein